MDAELRERAERVRALIEDGRCAPALFRAALDGVPPTARDAWVDLALGLPEPPGDGPELPRGCVPYLPCATEALLGATKHAGVGPSDVFVDVGSGVGRATSLVHLLTGARAIGIEVQPALVAAARHLVMRLGLPAVSFVEGDAAHATAALAAGSVFLLYCPFSGDRLRKLLDDLEAVARTRPIRICCVDLPLPRCDWLEPVPAPSLALTVHRSR